jgi:hypothetical protein
MAGPPPPRSNGEASPQQCRAGAGCGHTPGSGCSVRLARSRVSRRDRGEGLRGVGRVPGVHRPRLLGLVVGPASGRPLQPRGRAVQVGERALALGTAPGQPGGGHGRASIGGAGPGRLARAGPGRLTSTQAARTQAASRAASRTASRAASLPFGGHREDAAWRSHPVLTRAGGVHPWQFADGLLGRFPGRMTGCLGSAQRVQPVRGTERAHRLRRGVACPAPGRIVCVATQRGVPARGTARRAVAA